MIFEGHCIILQYINEILELSSLYCLNIKISDERLLDKLLLYADLSCTANFLVIGHPSSHHYPLIVFLNS
ncbi:hypothetical protein VNO80_18923 [Phaseolus coccineus]|uniref:Uncharacterized protein n=1 Tax=Phaseolus coccineus TaxID=3886 RepID=A0AAN9MF86_PHACN